MIVAGLAIALLIALSFVAFIWRKTALLASRKGTALTILHVVASHGIAGIVLAILAGAFVAFGFPVPFSHSYFENTGRTLVGTISTFVVLASLIGLWGILREAPKVTMDNSDGTTSNDSGT